VQQDLVGGFRFAAHFPGQEKLAEFIVGDVLRLTVPDYLAETEDDRTLCDFHRLLRILLDKQNR
jgi:hypothetical protein